MQAGGALQKPGVQTCARTGRRRVPVDEQWAGLSACLRVPLRSIALCKPKGVAAGSRGAPPQGEDWAGLPPELVAQIYAHLPLRDRKLGARAARHTQHPCPSGTASWVRAAPPTHTHPCIAAADRERRQPTHAWDC